MQHSNVNAKSDAVTNEYNNLNIK